MAGTQGLQQRGRTWYAVREVPRPLRTAMGGKRRLVKSLGTRDRHVARARLPAVLAEFQKEFDRAAAPGRAGATTEAALQWRETFARLDRGDDTAFPVYGADAPDPRFAAQAVLEEEADDIAAERGEAAARAFRGIAYGTATPVALHIDAWLAEGGRKGPLRPRTAAQYRADVIALAEWAKGVGVVTVEAFTKATAGRFVTEQLVAKGVHWATGNRKITAASSYWKWLRKRAGVEGEPWAGQSLSKGAGRPRSKRPFTDTEVLALLSGPADPELAHAMRVAALSGMRLEEIYRLTVADCAGGWFNVKVSKTRAGVRRVPIHSALADIVARRCASRAPEAFLFGEAGPARAGRERSAALSQRFSQYRQPLGVHDKAEGVRHSAVDFHSWRRWFVTSARNAGIDRATVAAVVGHEAGNLTDDTYSGGPAEALLRACVEAVRLPVERPGTGG